jgi:hypothetical protein
MDIELEGAEPVLDIHLEDRTHSGGCGAMPKTATRLRSSAAPI